MKYTTQYNAYNKIAYNKILTLTASEVAEICPFDHIFLLVGVDAVFFTNETTNDVSKNGKAWNGVIQGLRKALLRTKWNITLRWL